MRFFDAIANIFRIPDLRKRVGFTLALLAVYRLGGHIPIPGINLIRWDEIFSRNAGGIFGFFDMFAGGNIRRLTIFALGIMPYITSSIILQLLTVVVPTLEKLSKEGELGRRKITQWTRYFDCHSGAHPIHHRCEWIDGDAGEYRSQSGLWVHHNDRAVVDDGHGVHHVAGRADHRARYRQRHVADYLRRNCGWPAGTPSQVVYSNVFVTHEWNALTLIVILAMMIAVVAFIVLVERGERRIPVQYAKRVIGRRVMGGQQTHMPLKVNAGGVIPVIFASSILAFPQTLAPMPWVKNNAWLSSMLSSIRSGEPLYVLLFVASIVFFCFFYISIIFNPHETADNMRKYGGFIPGIRPGRNTADYMNNILVQDHGGGWPVPGDPLPDPGRNAPRHQAAAPAARRQCDRRHVPALSFGWLERAVLLRRHVAVDCCGRGHGHDQPDRGAVDHAAL